MKLEERMPREGVGTHYQPSYTRCDSTWVRRQCKARTREPLEENCFNLHEFDVGKKISLMAH